MKNILPNRLCLYAVTDCSWMKCGENLEKIVEILLQNGVTCVQLREKSVEHEQIVRDAKNLLPICRRYGVPLIINDDVKAVLESGADGVHLGQSDMELEKARIILGSQKIIGTSAHNVNEAIMAEKNNADYLGCGAVFGSLTKKDAGLLSKKELSAICDAVSIPVVAIGGISKNNILQLMGSGIAGVAVVSALFAQTDKAKATQEMLGLAKQVIKNN